MSQGSVVVDDERFEHRPQKYVQIVCDTLVYVGVADRAEFDKLAAPLTDHGENDRGHVLTKTVGDHGQNGVTVVFQYWVKSLTNAAFMADRQKAREAKATGAPS